MGKTFVSLEDTLNPLKPDYDGTSMRYLNDVSLDNFVKKYIIDNAIAHWSCGVLKLIKTGGRFEAK